MNRRYLEPEETEWDYYFDKGFHPDRYSQENL